MSVKNPWTMWGRVERCWLLALRSPLAEVQALLPSPMEAVSRGGFGFYNVVICRIGKMRPWPLPSLFGFSYWHVAYRIYVRFRNREGDWVEGLYFLRSDCDKAWLVPVGNLLTDFRFHQATLQFQTKEGEKIFRIRSVGGNGFLRLGAEVVGKTEEGSPFRDLQEAEDFLKYKPRGIGDPGVGSVQVVDIRRDEKAWQHRLVPVQEWRFDCLGDSKARLELCYEVLPIDYVWCKGRNEVTG